MSHLLKTFSTSLLLGGALIISSSLIGSRKVAFMNTLSPVRSLPLPATGDSSLIPGDEVGGPVKHGAVGDSSAAETAAAFNPLTAEASEVYSVIADLKKAGLSEKAFEYAWRGYQYLLKNNKLNRENVLTICDFSQSSRQKRLYIIDVETGKLIVNTYVAHGRNSGGEYANSFSNKPQSHKSSLGFYVTKKTYYGEHGLALRIDGLEKGFNDKADGRNIVIHGCDYVGPRHLRHNPFNGRSYGCPAIPASQTPKVINAIKNGSCLFIYHPSEKYLAGSKILNG